MREREKNVLSVSLRYIVWFQTGENFPLEKLTETERVRGRRVTLNTNQVHEISMN